MNEVFPTPDRAMPRLKTKRLTRASGKTRRPKPAARTRTQRHNFAVLVCDKDGTLADGNRLASSTRRALRRWQESGRKLVLATGETLDKLLDFADLELFDLVIAENGALLFWPRLQRSQLLTERCPPALLRELQRRGVTPHTVGKVIVSVKPPDDKVLEETLRSQLGWQVIHNREEVMALPKGIDKSTGLRCALKRLGLTRRQAVGIGDAQNDLVLLQTCGLGIAVATAVESLRREADIVTAGGCGAGVVEAIDHLLNANRRRDCPSYPTDAV